MKMFENRKICVFGGSVTIGSLIVEYLKTHDPDTIRIFSNDENSLWECQQKWGFKRLRYLLGDIRNFERVKLALKEIDYVFNCAAIKHVPFAEYNPMEAVTTNILGLENIINASIEKGVKKLLHISTDKAVEPTTIMGCTKMISERILQIRGHQNPKQIEMICVRLGNVLGSRGSIIPLVHKLKREGKPIIITDPNMERFFMNPIEVIKFIMKAFKCGKRGEIWIPKLKEEKLMDIISKEIGKKYPIEIIGKRKGEKIHEKLLSDYEVKIVEEKHRNYWILPYIHEGDY